MKKTLLALSIATAGQLAADCCNDCCEPCCVPQPKKCIDCECYTPKYYDLQCACDFFGTVDFLYWYGKETGLSYALRGENVPTEGKGAEELVAFLPASREVKWMEESWDPGVRVGIGANDVFCDGWELYFYWTYYHTKKNQKTSVEGLDEFLINPWAADTAIQGFFNSAIAIRAADANSINAIKAKWKLDYNTFDLELGRNYWLSSCFSMRPYMGIRGGWTKTRFKTSESQIIDGPPDASDVFFNSSANFKNKFWGVGLSGGFQPNWHLGCGFSIFGNADMALLWGCFDLVRDGFFSFEATDEGSSEIETSLFIDYGNSKSKFSAMQAILDLGAGLRYECTFCCDSYRFALDLGWEHHIWFDHNHRNQLDTSFSLQEDDSLLPALDNFRDIYGNLVLAGLVVRARFDF